MPEQLQQAAEPVGGVKEPDIYEQRRKQLIDVAIELFSAKGYTETTMRDIARAAGISVGLPYFYFRSKEEILSQAARWSTDRFVTLLECELVPDADPVTRLRTAMRSLVRMVDEKSDLHLLVYREMHSLEKETRRHITERELEMVGRIEQILEDGVRNGTFHPHNTRLRAHTLFFTAHMWALKRWALRSTITPEAFAEEQVEAILNGLLIEGRVEPYPGAAPE